MSSRRMALRGMLGLAAAVLIGPSGAWAAIDPAALPDNTWISMNATGDGPAAQYGNNGMPGPRAWFQADYDSTTGEITFFGGGSGTYMSDLWTYRVDENVWHLRRAHPDLSGPCRRDNQNFVYDPVNRLHWLFNGIAYHDLQLGCETGFQAVLGRGGIWTYDREHDVWAKVIDAQGALHRRLAPGMVYYPPTQSIFEFGGEVTGAPQNTTYRFDIATRTWTLLNPPVKPAARFNIESGLVYDSTHNLFVMFGGKPGPKGDTWVFDPVATTWTQRTPASSPPAREKHGMAYDPVHQVVILHGGQNGAGQALNDTWVYDVAANTWTQLALATPGPKSFHQSLVYDPVHQVVVFIPGDKVIDTWVFKYAPGTPPPADTARPSTPGNLQATARSASEVELTWTASTDNVAVTGYAISRGGSALTTAPAGTAVYRDPGLQPNTLYTYAVEALDSAGNRSVPATATVTTPQPPPPANQPPAADAGADRVIVLPASQVTLSGSGSDSDGTISSYAWSQQSGPSAAGLTGANTAALVAAQLAAGTYVFQLTVTDNGGATGTDAVSVRVDAATAPPATGQLQLPLKTFVVRTLPPSGQAPGRGGVKHTRLVFNPDDGKLYTMSGDWSGPCTGSACAPGVVSGSYRNEIYSYDVLSNTWQRETDYCMYPNVQPAHPDYNGVAYDTSRKMFWMHGGYQQGAGSPDACTQTNYTRNEMMAWSPLSKLWEGPQGRTSMFSPTVLGNPASLTKSAFYDESADALLWPTYDGRPALLRYHIPTNQWKKTRFSTGNGCVDDARLGDVGLAGWDPEHRILLVLEQKGASSTCAGYKRLWKINAGCVETSGTNANACLAWEDLPANIRAGHDHERVVWDSVSHVLLYPFHGGQVWDPNQFQFSVWTPPAGYPATWNQPGSWEVLVDYVNGIQAPTEPPNFAPYPQGPECNCALTTAGCPVSADCPLVRGSQIGFDPAQNAMVMYGGTGPWSSHLYLFRYGNGSGASPQRGDLNADGAVDGTDMQRMINVLLGLESSAAILGRADLDASGQVNAADLQQLINLLLPPV